MTDDGPSITLTSFPHFSDSDGVSEKYSNNGYHSSNNHGAIIGSAYSIIPRSVTDSFQGIIHSIFIKSGAMTTQEIKSEWITPRDSSNILCDYFIGHFPALNTHTTGSFKNTMYGYASQNQALTNSNSATIDVTDGINFNSGDLQTITGITVTDQRAIGVQMWFKGTFADNDKIIGFETVSGPPLVYFERVGNDIKVSQPFSDLEIVFSSAVTSVAANRWTLFGLSAGWMARSNNYMI
jgi:hypothetical protein